MNVPFKNKTDGIRLPVTKSINWLVLS